jgi:hypothetical protein
MSTVIAALLLGSVLPATRSLPSPPFEHVVLISVDGLRSDVLEAPHIDGLPNFARLLRGPHTLDARTDPQYTVTLPNHVSMLTGRPVLGPYGHNWTSNDDPAAGKHGGTLHIHKGAYIPSVFDAAHDAGLATTCAASKTKFWLFEQSYGEAHGAPDTTGPDNGRSKIDLFVFGDRTPVLAATLADGLRRTSGPSFHFIHFAAPDVAGHSYDWQVKPGSKYMASIEEADAALGVILGAIDGDPDLRARTAVILTTDHGGGVPRKTHTDITCPLNFRIPFLMWMGQDGAAVDLYAVNPDRHRPGREELVGRDAERQPIRNGDAANAALGLLGLQAIDGAFYGTISGPIRHHPRAEYK